VLVVIASFQRMEVAAAAAGGQASPARRGTVPRLFWIFAAALVVYGVCETMFGNWGTTLLVGNGVAATSANEALAAFWAMVTVGRLAIAIASTKIASTRIYVVLPWAIAAALLVAPLARSAGAGIAVFAFGGLACSGFFPMSLGYGESTFPAIIELATGWLIASYQVGYGLAAFGGGALQRVVALSTVFRIAAVTAVGMSLLALAIARRQRQPEGPTVSPVPAT